MLAVALLTIILGTFPPQCPTSTLQAGKDQAVANLTILFFTASWCEPCHAVQPILEKFTRKHPKEVRFVPVDFDRSPDEVARWDVRKIANLSYRICNNLITPADSGEATGMVYTRNVVFKLVSSRAGKQLPARDAIIVKLEDLGARYNSHCVTCIGSG